MKKSGNWLHSDFNISDLVGKFKQKNKTARTHSNMSEAAKIVILIVFGVLLVAGLITFLIIRFYEPAITEGKITSLIYDPEHKTYTEREKMVYTKQNIIIQLRRIQIQMVTLVLEELGSLERF